MQTRKRNTIVLDIKHLDQAQAVVVDMVVAEWT